MKKIEVVAAVIKDKNKYLIAKRNKGIFKNFWEFPGGKIENSETHEQTIIREIKEELNLDIILNGFIRTITYNYENNKIILHFYYCKIINGSILLSSHSECKWIEKKYFSIFNWIPADQLIFNYLI